MSKTELPPFLEESQTDEVELAKQLINLRQPPGAALQHRIRSIPQQQAQRTHPIPHLAWGIVALLIVALLFTSPVAKATLGELEKVVGQIHLTVRDVLPQYPASVAVESTPTSLEEVQALIPFDFDVPTSLPPGLTTIDEVAVIKLEMPIVKILWRDTEGSFVQLTAHAHNRENSLAQTLIGPASSETMLINGQTAVLVRGGWDEASRTWDHQDQLTTIIWEVNGIQYKLLSFSSVVSLTELVTMAESVR